MASIGFIGLGNMGAPMAANLVKAGHGVTGYDLNPAALRTLIAAGGRGAASAAEAAKGADVVITMLPAGEDVREVWLHQGGLIEAVGNAKNAKPLLIDCSTIDVDSARTVTAAAEAAGLAMLDAPVSGGTIGAQNATLTFMVGGTEDAFARGKPILAAMGKNIFHAGGPGAGQAVKICNNMMLAINMVGVCRGLPARREARPRLEQASRDLLDRERQLLGACRPIVPRPDRCRRRRRTATTRRAS